MKTITRPITPIEDFEKAFKSASLSKSEEELIEYIRYTGIFSQPIITKDLRLNSKPPVLSVLCEVCRKIGSNMPNHFNAIREWSKAINPDGIKWDGDLICSGIRNIDGELLAPETGTSLYHFLAVHKELFTGLN